MEHKVIYALDANKNIVNITDSITKGTKLFCPCCSCTVFAVNKGSKRKHHFRHDYEHFDYEHKGESEIHNYSKNVLKFILENYLVEIKTCCELLSICKNYSHVVLEKHCEFLRWDVACLDMDNNIKYGFEVKHTHKAEEKTRQCNIWFEIEADEIVNIEDIEGKIILNCIRKCEKCLNKTCVFKRESSITKIQRGAGSGKTYETIQFLKCEDVRIPEEVDTFIYATKMNSAKDVIREELNSQYEKKHISNLELITEDTKNKRYIYRFNNNLKNKEITVFICTVDSLYYSFVDTHRVKNKITFDVFKMFAELLSTAKQFRKPKFLEEKLNTPENISIIIDEVQDLDMVYINALENILENYKGISCFLMGDKLQSIWRHNNVFTVDRITSNIKYTEDTPTNEFRRSEQEEIIQFVNKHVDFKKYNLPLMSNVKNKVYNQEHVVHGIKFEKVYHQEYNIYKLSEYIENEIISIMKILVQEYKYKPRDFHFIFPIVNGLYPQLLQLQLNDFWSVLYNKIENNYAVLHKSNEGKSIDLKTSENASRITSIHTAKGTGRPVVFILDLTDSSLRFYSGGERNIIFDSLLHVALTRAKERMYISSDFIFNSEEHFMIEKKINLEDVVENFANKELFNYIIPEYPFPESFQNDAIIDMQHHYIRRDILKYNIYKKISEKTEDGFKDQVNTKVNNYINTVGKGVSIVCVKDYQKWLHDICGYNMTRILGIEKQRQDVLQFNLPKYNCENQDSEFYEFPSMLKDILTNIKNKLYIQRSKRRSEEECIGGYLPDLCPLESVAYVYAETTIGITSFQNKSHNVVDVYNIINYYKNKVEYSSLNLEEHSKQFKCLCSKHFKIKNVMKNKDNNFKIITKHYDIVRSINNIFEKSYKHIQEIMVKNNDDSKIIFNVDKTISFTIKDYQKFWNKIEFIGYSEKHVVILLPIPQFNKLNFHKYIYTMILYKYIINKHDLDKDNSKYRNKNLINCIISLNPPTYYIWTDSIDFIETDKHFNEYIEKKYKNYNNSLIEHIDKHVENIDKVLVNYEKEEKTKNIPEYMYDAVKNMKIKIKKKPYNKDMFIEILNDYYENI